MPLRWASCLFRPARDTATSLEVNPNACPPELQEQLSLRGTALLRPRGSNILYERTDDAGQGAFTPPVVIYIKRLPVCGGLDVCIKRTLVTHFVCRAAREARLQVQLQHPHLLPALASVRGRHHYYLVLPAADSDLWAEAEAMRQQGTGYSEDELRELTRQILLGLEHLHSNNLAHRDIKPANVLRMPDGRVTVADFGCTDSCTGGFVAAGTAQFQPPECRRNAGAQVAVLSKGYDQRMQDTWSVGATVASLWFAQLPEVLRGSGSSRVSGAMAVAAAAAAAAANRYSSFYTSGSSTRTSTAVSQGPASFLSATNLHHHVSGRVSTAGAAAPVSFLSASGHLSSRGSAAVLSGGPATSIPAASPTLIGRGSAGLFGGPSATATAGEAGEAGEAGGSGSDMTTVPLMLVAVPPPPLPPFLAAAGFAACGSTVGSRGEPMSDEMIDFLSRLLRLRSSERITVQQALRHEWLIAGEQGRVVDSSMVGLEAVNALPPPVATRRSPSPLQMTSSPSSPPDHIRTSAGVRFLPFGSHPQMSLHASSSSPPVTLISQRSSSASAAAAVVAAAEAAMHGGAGMHPASPSSPLVKLVPPKRCSTSIMASAAVVAAADGTGMQPELAALRHLQQRQRRPQQRGEEEYDDVEEEEEMTEPADQEAQQRRSRPSTATTTAALTTVTTTTTTTRSSVSDTATPQSDAGTPQHLSTTSQKGRSVSPCVISHCQSHNGSSPGSEAARSPGEKPQLLALRQRQRQARQERQEQHSHPLAQSPWVVQSSPQTHNPKTRAQRAILRVFVGAGGESSGSN